MTHADNNIHRAGNPFGRARLCCLFWLMQNQSGDSNAPDCCTARRNSRGLQDELIAQRSLAGVVARALASSTRLPSRVRPRPLATCRATRRVGGRRTRSNTCCASLHDFSAFAATLAILVKPPAGFAGLEPLAGSATHSDSRLLLPSVVVSISCCFRAQDMVLMEAVVDVEDSIGIHEPASCS